MIRIKNGLLGTTKKDTHFLGKFRLLKLLLVHIAEQKMYLSLG